MQNTILAKNNWKYLLILIMLAIIAIGVVVGNDQYPTRLGSYSQEPPFVLGVEGPCDFSNLYLTFPPKCMALDGAFIPVPGSYIPVMPEGK